jgi:hypothetical protein
VAASTYNSRLEQCRRLAGNPELNMEQGTTARRVELRRTIGITAGGDRPGREITARGRIRWL